MLHSILPPFQNLRAGATITWDGGAWQVANIGSTTIALLGEDGKLLELPDSTVESLIEECRIMQSPDNRELNTCQRISDALLHASEEISESPITGPTSFINASPGESDWSRRTGANIAPMNLTIPHHRVPIRRRVHWTVAADQSSWESNVPLVGQALG
jgi:hypothetical protein